MSDLKNSVLKSNHRERSWNSNSVYRYLCSYSLLIGKHKFIIPLPHLARIPHKLENIGNNVEKDLIHQFSNILAFFVAS